MKCHMAGYFTRVCTVWLDTIQVLHHAVPGLSLFCPQDDHHRYKLIKNGGRLEFVDSEDHGSVGPVFSVHKMPFS